MEIDAAEVELQYGIQTLPEESFLQDCGILDEGVVSVHMSLDGGKRKRKKKVHTTPKRIPHKHKKRPKALLEYFSVDDASGKVKRLKQESPNAAGLTWLIIKTDSPVVRPELNSSSSPLMVRDFLTQNKTKLLRLSRRSLKPPQRRRERSDQFIISGCFSLPILI